MTDNQEERGWAGAENTEDLFPFPSPTERALDEIAGILNQMLALAELSAGSIDVDRDALQAELEHLKEELDRVADGIAIDGFPPLRP